MDLPTQVPVSFVTRRRALSDMTGLTEQLYWEMQWMLTTLERDYWRDRMEQKWKTDQR